VDESRCVSFAPPTSPPPAFWRVRRRTPREAVGPCRVDDRVSIRLRRHHRVVDHLGAGDVHRGVVLGAVWTYDCHALIAIASGALSFVDLLPAEAVYFIDDPPNDVIGVTGAQRGEFPPVRASLVPSQREARQRRDGEPSCRGDPISNSSLSMLVPTAKNLTVWPVQGPVAGPIGWQRSLASKYHARASHGCLETPARRPRVARQDARPIRSG